MEALYYVRKTPLASQWAQRDRPRRPRVQGWQVLVGDNLGVRYKFGSARLTRAERIGHGRCSRVRPRPWRYAPVTVCSVEFELRPMRGVAALYADKIAFDRG